MAGQLKELHARRPSGRAPDALRPVSLVAGFARHAEGSCLIRISNTEVLCAVSAEARVPPFLRGSGKGRVTAEYGMQRAGSGAMALPDREGNADWDI